MKSWSALGLGIWLSGMAVGWGWAQEPPTPWPGSPALRGVNTSAVRTVFIRGETIRVTAPVPVATAATARLAVALTLEDDQGVGVWRWTGTRRDLRAGAPPIEVNIDSAPWRPGAYRLLIHGEAGARHWAAECPLWLVSSPDRDGLVWGMLVEQIRRGPVLEAQLRELRAMGFGAVMHYQPTPELMETVLRHGMSGLAILHGNAGAGGFKGDRAATARLNARGVPFEHDPAKPGSGRWGIAHPGWQAAVAVSMEAAVRKWAAYPGFWPMINTSDDYYRWTGLDYHPSNVAAFQARYGIDPPRPPEALAADYPMRVDRETGVIPDSDPWLLWQRFNSREVLGRYNGRLAEAVRRATDGQGRIGPVCGGGPWTLGTIPLVDLPSGQWPPHNFGPDHFSLISYYNYNCYWYPAIAQVWWAELARMGNRRAPVWVMPDTMDLRRTYHLQNLWMFLAGGVDGVVYFIYEWMSPGSRDALSRMGPQIEAAQAVLGALEPAPRSIGLLAPFETAAYRASHPADLAYAFAQVAMAQGEVEPVWPEELPERGSAYRLILLHDVDWLTESNRRRLSAFQARGGRVVADAATAVDQPGWERLDFALAEPVRETGYGDTQRIARIRAELKRWSIASWAQTDDPHLLLRHAQLDGVDYLWVISLMTHEEDAAHLPPQPGRDFKVPPAPGFEDHDRRGHTAVLTVPAAAASCPVDVLGRHAAPERVLRGDRCELRLEVPAWQGRLLAFYPQRPDRLVVEAPESVRRGRRLSIRVRIRAEGRPVRMALPLIVEAIAPDGRARSDYRRSVLARGGEARWDWEIARNEIPGDWRIRVRETTLDLAGEKDFTVR